MAGVARVAGHCSSNGGGRVPEDFRTPLALAEVSNCAHGGLMPDRPSSD